MRVHFLVSGTFAQMEGAALDPSKSVRGDKVPLVTVVESQRDQHHPARDDRRLLDISYRQITARPREGEIP